MFFPIIDRDATDLWSSVVHLRQPDWLVHNMQLVTWAGYSCLTWELLQKTSGTQKGPVDVTTSVKLQFKMDW